MYEILTSTSVDLASSLIHKLDFNNITNITDAVTGKNVTATDIVYGKIYSENTYISVFTKDNKITFKYCNGSYESSTELTIAQWNKIDIVANTSTVYLYINGVLDRYFPKTIEINPATFNIDPIYIGTNPYYYNASNYYLGQLSFSATSVDSDTILKDYLTERQNYVN